MINSCPWPVGSATLKKVRKHINNALSVVL